MCSRHYILSINIFQAGDINHLLKMMFLNLLLQLTKIFPFKMGF